MRKVVILTLVTLFTCVEYSQAQTTEKEMTRQEKKAAQEALDKMLFQEAKEAIDNQTFVLEADKPVAEVCLGGAEIKGVKRNE